MYPLHCYENQKIVNKEAARNEKAGWMKGVMKQRGRIKEGGRAKREVGGEWER